MRRRYFPVVESLYARVVPSGVAVGPLPEVGPSALGGVLAPPGGDGVEDLDRNPVRLDFPYADDGDASAAGYPPGDYSPPQGGGLGPVSAPPENPPDLGIFDATDTSAPTGLGDPPVVLADAGTTSDPVDDVVSPPDPYDSGDPDFA